MSFEVARWQGVDTIVCRTGYTGEHGYELVLPVSAAVAAWDALIAAGVRPCGLAARDTLRTEMGYPLHGHELSLEITPVQARVGWAVGWTKAEFWGRAALVAEKAAGPRRALMAVLTDHLERRFSGQPEGRATTWNQPTPPVSRASVSGAARSFP